MTPPTGTPLDAVAATIVAAAVDTPAGPAGDGVPSVADATHAKGNCTRMVAAEERPARLQAVTTVAVASATAAAPAAAAARSGVAVLMTRGHAGQSPPANSCKRLRRRWAPPQPPCDTPTRNGVRGRRCSRPCPPFPRAASAGDEQSSPIQGKYRSAAGSGGDPQEPGSDNGGGPGGRPRPNRGAHRRRRVAWRR